MLGAGEMKLRDDNNVRLPISGTSAFQVGRCFTSRKYFPAKEEGQLERDQSAQALVLLAGREIHLKWALMDGMQCEEMTCTLSEVRSERHCSVAAESQ